MTMLQLDARQLAARLDRQTLIDALDAAFRGEHSVPDRQHYTVPATHPGEAGGTLLVMPAWRGGSLGIKLVTVFPDNAKRGLPAPPTCSWMRRPANRAPSSTAANSLCGAPQLRQPSHLDIYPPPPRRAC
jgi:ornithine cyclodeaminase